MFLYPFLIFLMAVRLMVLNLLHLAIPIMMSWTAAANDSTASGGSEGNEDERNWERYPTYSCPRFLLLYFPFCHPLLILYVFLQL